MMYDIKVILPPCYTFPPEVSSSLWWTWTCTSDSRKVS